MSDTLPVIITPLITYPSYGIVLYTSDSFVVTPTDFATSPNVGVTQIYSDWEICSGPDGTGSTLFSSYLDYFNLNAIFVDISTIAPSPVYYVRVRYTGLYNSEYITSDWSLGNAFGINFDKPIADAQADILSYRIDPNNTVFDPIALNIGLDINFTNYGKYTNAFSLKKQSNEVIRAKLPISKIYSKMINLYANKISLPNYKQCNIFAPVKSLILKSSSNIKSIKNISFVASFTHTTNKRFTFNTFSYLVSLIDMKCRTYPVRNNTSNKLVFSSIFSTENRTKNIISKNVYCLTSLGYSNFSVKKLCNNKILGPSILYSFYGYKLYSEPYRINPPFIRTVTYSNHSILEKELNFIGKIYFCRFHTYEYSNLSLTHLPLNSFRTLNSLPTIFSASKINNSNIKLFGTDLTGNIQVVYKPIKSIIYSFKSNLMNISYNKTLKSLSYIGIIHHPLITFISSLNARSLRFNYNISSKLAGSYSNNNIDKLYHPQRTITSIFTEQSLQSAHNILNNCRMINMSFKLKKWRCQNDIILSRILKIEITGRLNSAYRYNFMKQVGRFTHTNH